MKTTIFALFLSLAATSAYAVEAQNVNRGDLFGACIAYQNAKWKSQLEGTLNYLSAAKQQQLAPYGFDAMRQQCACTVTAAFKDLSQDTIAAYSKALDAHGDGVVIKPQAASDAFKKAAMMDKTIACAESSLESSGFTKKLLELSK